MYLVFGKYLLTLQFAEDVESCQQTPSSLVVLINYLLQLSLVGTYVRGQLEYHRYTYVPLVLAEELRSCQQGTNFVIGYFLVILIICFIFCFKRWNSNFPDLFYCCSPACCLLFKDFPFLSEINSLELVRLYASYAYLWGSSDDIRCTCTVLRTGT